MTEENINSLNSSYFFYEKLPNLFASQIFILILITQKIKRTYSSVLLINDTYLLIKSYLNLNESRPLQYHPVKMLANFYV